MYAFTFVPAACASTQTRKTFDTPSAEPVLICRHPMPSMYAHADWLE